MSTEFKRIEGSSTGRIVLYSDSEEAGYIEYETRKDGSLNVYETVIYEAFRGKGLAGLLFDELIKFAQEKNHKIFPTCSFVVKGFERNEDLRYLLAADYTA